MTSHPSPDPDDLNFSVLPPTELLSEWETDILYEYQNIDITLLKAYQAGANAELEACCEHLKRIWSPSDTIESLHAARRPKPPSLKEQALQALYRFDDTEGHEGLTPEQIAEDFVLIRRALESLPE